MNQIVINTDHPIIKGTQMSLLALLSTCTCMYVHVHLQPTAPISRLGIQVSCAQCVCRYGFGLFTCTCIWVYGLHLSSTSL